MSTSLPTLNNNHQGALEKSPEPLAWWPAAEDCGRPGQLPDLNMFKYV